MSEPVDIELAQQADLPRILELSNWAAIHTAANFSTAPESLEMWTQAWEKTHAFYPWLVARTSSAIVGFAKASPHRTRGAYAWTAEVSVYIDDSWQGRGVGRLLLRALAQLTNAQGYGVLLAGIVDGHQASEKLHARVGFNRCGTFHRAGYKLGRWYDVGWWELLLSATVAAPTQIQPVAGIARGVLGSARLPTAIEG